jgi:hypothetical protein
VAILVLAALGLLTPHVSALALGICAAVIVGVAVADRIHPPHGDTDTPHLAPTAKPARS